MSDMDGNGRHRVIELITNVINGSGCSHYTKC